MDIDTVQNGALFEEAARILEITGALSESDLMRYFKDNCTC